MNKLMAAVAALVVTVGSIVHAEDLFIGANSGTLPAKCTFSNKSNGTLNYSTSNVAFVSSGGGTSAASVDIAYRNMTNITIISDGVISEVSPAVNHADKINNINYANASSKLGSTLVSNNGINNLRGDVTPQAGEATETLTILPTAMFIHAGFAADTLKTNKDYSFKFVVTCVE